MKVFGIVLLLSGILFTLYTGLGETAVDTPTTSWGPWVGVLVFLTGGFFYFRARNEE
jgi:LPXTG-motif cell wall-anchored protein